MSEPLSRPEVKHVACDLISKNNVMEMSFFPRQMAIWLYLQRPRPVVENHTFSTARHDSLGQDTLINHYFELLQQIVTNPEVTNEQARIYN